MTAALHYFLNTTLPGLADHLWQSTLFALAAALLILTLRKQSARIRYLVWLAASLKFLVPFSLLVALGSWLSPAHAPAQANSGIYFVEQVAQPFTQPLSPVHATVTIVANSPTPFHWQALLLVTWLGGAMAALLIWLSRWWKLCAARRHAIAAPESREAAALHRLESSVGTVGRLKLLLSHGSVEPGVFGIFRPVLLWPSSISDHLDDCHLDAVLAHELCHVQRQDNLAAALHMLVESIFWFHPLVWWLGTRLIEERERACDEAVVEMGGGRHTYAESILKVCEFCLSSPLSCVSGVTGSDLKKRMVHIMTNSIVRKLNFTRKLALWMAACLAIAVPVFYGLLNPIPGHAASETGAAPSYVNVSIKPHPEDPNGMARAKIMISLMDANFTARGVSAQSLIQLAYHVQDAQVVESPDWLGSAKFDIDARMDKAAADQWQKLSEEQRGALAGQMLQGLLAGQFKLKVHQEARDLPAFELSVAEGGSKLQKMAEGKHGFMHMGMGELSANGAPLDLLAAQLSMRLGRPVVDKSGLNGNYAYTLHWTPDAEERARMQQKELIAPDSQAADASGPTLLTAIQDQLGLTLQPVTTRVQVLVIDHIEQPGQE
ncbi:MAG TPA: M56 family metallopeptidase [Terriglobales bacterium]|nr:M56 family metallopeptidase [Terriglobales bacterium]